MIWNLIRYTVLLLIDNEIDQDIGNDVIESNAQILYGLIHQRFITTRSGLQVYKERLLEAEFGVCPRVGCHSSLLAPCGLSNLPGNNINIRSWYSKTVLL